MIHFVIPAYNEAENLTILFGTLMGFLTAMGLKGNIILVDDGSTDETPQLIRSFQENQSSFRILHVQHETNKGVGQGFRSGFTKALEEGSEGDWIVTLEADNSSDLRILPQLIEKAKDHDLVLSSCYMRGGQVINTGFLRRVLSLGSNTLLRLLCPTQGVHTYSSFYRLYQWSVVKEMRDLTGGQYFETPGFACVIELLFRIHLTGKRVAEVPTILMWDPRRRVSKLRIRRTMLEVLRVIQRRLRGDFAPSIKGNA